MPTEQLEKIKHELESSKMRVSVIRDGAFYVIVNEYRFEAQRLITDRLSNYPSLRMGDIELYAGPDIGHCGIEEKIKENLNSKGLYFTEDMKKWRAYTIISIESDLGDGL